MGINFGGGPKVGGGLGFAGGINVGKPAPDPLIDVEYTDDLATDAARELTAMEQAYRGRAKAEAQRFKNATDSEFWFAVCFETREEKEAFLAEFRVGGLGDKYVNGSSLAKRLRSLIGGK